MSNTRVNELAQQFYGMPFSHLIQLSQHSEHAREIPRWVERTAKGTESGPYLLPTPIFSLEELELAESIINDLKGTKKG